jgi:hypothetical protein
MPTVENKIIFVFLKPNCRLLSSLQVFLVSLGLLEL